MGGADGHCGIVAAHAVVISQGRAADRLRTIADSRSGTAVPGNGPAIGMCA